MAEEESENTVTWRMGIVGIVLTGLVSVITSHLQETAALDLEQRRFEETLVQRVFDEHDPAERRRYLKFLVDSGLTEHLEETLRAMLDNDEEIPRLHRRVAILDGPLPTTPER